MVAAALIMLGGSGLSGDIRLIIWLGRIASCLESNDLIESHPIIWLW